VHALHFCDKRVTGRAAGIRWELRWQVCCVCHAVRADCLQVGLHQMQGHSAPAKSGQQKLLSSRNDMLQIQELFAQ